MIINDLQLIATYHHIPTTYSHSRVATTAPIIRNACADQFTTTAATTARCTATRQSPAAFRQQRRASAAAAAGGRCKAAYSSNTGVKRQERADETDVCPIMCARKWCPNILPDNVHETSARKGFWRERKKPGTCPTICSLCPKTCPTIF